MLFYEIKLNGKDITNSVSIGATIQEKLAEPMDDGSIHLPLSILDIEYTMKGFLEITIEEDEDLRKYEFLIINDNVNEGSKYGDYKHDLTVMEYSGKADDYIIRSFASTKIIKEEGEAPFTYNSYDINGFTSDNNGEIWIYQRLYMPKIDVKKMYYADEPIVIESVGYGKQGILDIYNDGLTYKFIPLFLKATKEGGLTQTVNISDNDSNFVLSEGWWTFEYGFYNTISYDVSTPTNQDISIYKFKVRIISREFVSIYDLLTQISDMVSKWGGIESKHYYNSTRLFEIDEDIADYLKSVEAPQMYFQKLTLRQALNTVFSYVNAISRLKKDNGNNIDKLTMDEFNKITGIFDLEDGVVGYSTQRSGSELTLKGVSFLERVMPSDLEEPTIETPANEMFKTVRAIDIQMTQDSFELKLERPIYKPKKLESLLKDVTILYRTTTHPNNLLEYGTFDYVLDLINRWINIEEWKLKEITTNFPSVYSTKPFEQNVGLAKNMTENLYWQEGDKSIKMSDLFGVAWKSNLIINVIKSAFFEYITRNNINPIIEEYYDAINQTTYSLMMSTYVFNIDFGTWTTSGSTMKDKLLFNVEYISLEDIVIDVDRKDITDNFNYYSEAKLNQTDKIVAAGLATRGMSGDIQRSGVRDLVVTQYHSKLSEVLKTGMYNPKNRLTITEMKLNLQNEFIAATYMLSKDFNRSQMFRALMQEYRWSEIPTSRQIHDRHELYKDYLIVLRPTKQISSTKTKIAVGTSKIIFDVLKNQSYADDTKITFALVRTDGMAEIYDEEVLKGFIMTPVSSFGIKDGLSFSFGFDSNLIAGDGLKTVITGNSQTYYNEAVRYTDLDGRFTKFWFALGQQGLSDLSAEGLALYPLLKISMLPETNITCGPVMFNNVLNDYLVWNKDSRQNAKLSYQISILPEEHNLYVFGQSFFSNNYLVKNRGDGTPKVLYIYDDEENYEFLKYGIFDDLKIKKGYNEDKKVRQLATGNRITLDYYEARLRIRFSQEIMDLKGTHWAIGDQEGNLYVASNEFINGFDVIDRHTRPNILEIGDFILPPESRTLNKNIKLSVTLVYSRV